MAKKESRGDQYRRILSEYGKRLEDCRVLAFTFDYQMRVELFHYDLMGPYNPKYYIFDCFGNVAQIVVPKDPENEALCVRLAKDNKGQKTIPIL